MELVKTTDAGFVFIMNAFDLMSLDKGDFAALKNRAYHVLRRAGIANDVAFAIRMQSHQFGRRTNLRYALYVRTH